MDFGETVCKTVRPMPSERRLSCLSDSSVCSLGGWIMMPLGTEVGLGPGYIVLDGDPASPQKGYTPHFWPCLLRLNG